MKKNKIVITGGAGFVGTNLIALLLKKTKFNIISIDNYSSGFKKNHFKNNRVKYIKADTKDISQILKNTKIFTQLRLILFQLLLAKEKLYFLMTMIMWQLLVMQT